MDWIVWWEEIRKQKFGYNQIQLVRKSHSENAPIITAHTWVILDAANGRLIWGKNEHSKREIASITKTMTAFVTLKLIEQLKIDPSKVEVEITEFAASIGGTSAFFQQGDIVTLIDLLYALMLPSGNDAALAIAENLGVYLYFQHKVFQAKKDDLKDNDQVTITNPALYFVQEMNKAAQKLGLSNTYFTNPHGLPHRLNKSTSYDIGKLCFHALKIPLLQKIINTRLYASKIKRQGQDYTIIWENTNKLLEHGFSGIKTGTTNDAGPCLASLFQGRKHTYIIITLNCRTKDDRWSDACKLADWVTDVYEKY